MTFPRDLKDKPIIYNLIKKFDIVPNIIEASFSTEVGWALLVMAGDDTELKKAIDYLRQKNVTINNIEKIEK